MLEAAFSTTELLFSVVMRPSWKQSRNKTSPNMTAEWNRGTQSRFSWELFQWQKRLCTYKNICFSTIIKIHFPKNGTHLCVEIGVPVFLQKKVVPYNTGHFQLRNFAKITCEDTELYWKSGTVQNIALIYDILVLHTWIMRLCIISLIMKSFQNRKTLQYSC